MNPLARVAYALRGGPRRARRATVLGVRLRVLPDVFDPEVFRSGVVLAEAVEAEVQPGEAVLDLGTGSGVGALFAARNGASVVAVDLSPAAVHCAHVNALMHGLDDRIAVRQGDLFPPGERFDVVLFNPPYFAGEPQGAWDLAWRSPDVLERFAAGLPDALAPGGRAVVVLSTHGRGDHLLARLRQAYKLDVLVERRFPGEVLTAWRVG